jgi:hypothetical protein
MSPTDEDIERASAWFRTHSLESWPLEILLRLQSDLSYAREEIARVTVERDAAHTDIDTLMQINLDLVQEIDGLRAAMHAIIDRSNNREMGTGKVPDMREIAVKALGDTSLWICRDPMSASRERIAALEGALEHVGQVGNVCVGRTLGRRCDYCACDGKNLVDAVLSGGVGN